MSLYKVLFVFLGTASALVFSKQSFTINKKIISDKKNKEMLVSKKQTNYSEIRSSITTLIKALDESFEKFKSLVNFTELDKKINKENSSLSELNNTIKKLNQQIETKNTEIDSKNKEETKKINDYITKINEEQQKFASTNHTKNETLTANVKKITDLYEKVFELIKKPEEAEK